jgi:hypothetical protein
MTFFEEVISRIKKVTNLQEDAEIAKLLGMKPSTFAMRKKRGKLPKKEIELCAAKNGISTDWLFTGQGETFPSPLPQFSMAVTKKELDWLLQLTRKVLLSDYLLAREALKSNIICFADAVDQRNDKEDLRGKVERIESRLGEHPGAEGDTG